ncbi:MAG: hypothetical protein ICV65_04955 [Flavisolibacter sp.]|nr:hypothetical protein [Flavisolibacter sp.]
MKKRFLILNLFSVSLLLIALYLNFIHKENNLQTAGYSLLQKTATTGMQAEHPKSDRYLLNKSEQKNETASIQVKENSTQ